MISTALQHIDITCTDVSKSYNREPVFRNVNLQCLSGESIAITGSNGSGKSTLLSMLSGFSSPNNGNITWVERGAKTIARDEWFKSMSIAAPYIDLVDEFTVHEMAVFQRGFKPLYFDMTVDELLTRAMLSEHAHKLVKSLSSGMKQRLKVSLGLLSHVPVVFLDEPTSNLDVKGKEWFAQMLKTYSDQRLVIIATNEPYDIGLCSRTCDIMAFK